MSEEQNKLRELVASVAAAYLSNNHAGPAEIPQIIGQITTSLSAVSETGALPAAPAAPAEAPVKLTSARIARSITPDTLISFEDGKPYKTLRRHLATRGLTPEQYREKWGLPTDYPLVSPNYSAARSALAKKLGLGSRPQPKRARRKGSSAG